MVPALPCADAGLPLLQPKLVRDAKGGKEIPIPGVHRVASYRQVGAGTRRWGGWRRGMK